MEQELNHSQSWEIRYTLNKRDKFQAFTLSRQLPSRDHIRFLKKGFMDPLKICCGRHEGNVHVWCGQRAFINGTKVFGSKKLRATVVTSDKNGLNSTERDGIVEETSANAEKLDCSRE
ncbi:hypothetical protein POM88_049946 [Heracleum sosnowskyi]|uniref:Uncharacterized protein n=1 Tax=Heracleum sosnowskyi TaxID=360622 RepID=A0AAD8GWM1_9APIA|nr:hypothetical protein POM88_049946 [Heracleum sosnowskyi]